MGENNKIAPLTIVPIKNAFLEAIFILPCLLFGWMIFLNFLIVFHFKLSLPCYQCFAFGENW